MPPLSLRVLISGGGIAGNALAFFLARQGHDVTVVERFPDLRATGLQLDLRGPGIEVLRRMGLEDAFRAKAAPEQGMQWVDSSGRRRAYFPANTSGNGRQSFSSEFEIMRGDLCRLLYDAARTCKNPPRYVFGTAIESLVQHNKSNQNSNHNHNHNGNTVEVRFEDGKTDRFDLVVGADGQWSRTRRMMLGSRVHNGNPGMHRVPGLYFAYFTMRRPMEEGDEYLATSYMAPGRRGMLTRRHSPHGIQVMLSCKTDPNRLEDVPRGDVKREKHAMAEIFKGAGWLTEDILKAMSVAHDFYLERYGMVKLPSWSSGQVALVGDAAYCPTVLTGMGTTCAMVGAYILAGEVGRYCAQGDGSDSNSPKNKSGGLVTALGNYERKFRPFMDKMQEGVLEKAESQWAMTGSAFSIGVLNCFMSLASFFKLNIADFFGIRETVKGWELPDYRGIVPDEA
jgi:2-polyprenyl-6-methoxyphenol hydroxylase-like FAD-dependent oxidoreductase